MSADTRHVRLVQIAYDLHDEGAYVSARSVAQVADDRDKLLLALQGCLVELTHCHERLDTPRYFKLCHEGLDAAPRYFRRMYWIGAAKEAIAQARKGMVECGRERRSNDGQLYEHDGPAVPSGAVDAALRDEVNRGRTEEPC